MIKTLKKLFKNDNGYSLLEIGIATGIMVIGFSVAAPALNQAMQNASENETKSNLYQASLVIEDARYQNEGAYPTLMPDELVNNPAMADFRYTYSDDQTIFCLMGRDDTGQKWFVGNLATEPYVPTPDQPGCTQDNLASNSKALGEDPVMIPAEVTGTNTWEFSEYDYSVANMSWGGGSCTPSTTDPEPGAVQKIEYQVRVVNTSTGEIIEAQNGDWIMGTAMNSIALQDWLPNDEISYQQRMRCTYDYETYYDSWAAAPDTIDEFPVEGSLVKKVPAPEMTWTFSQEFPVISYSGTEITCPIVASPRYRAIVTQGDKEIKFGWMATPEYNNLSLTNFVARENVYIFSEASCKINNTYYVANSAPPSNINAADVYSGDGPGSTVGPFLPPDPPPASVMGIYCVTKYERLDEATKGDCRYDPNIADSTYVPNAISWGSAGCLPGYEVEYLIRRSAPNTTEWVSTGSTPSYNIGTNTVNPGALVTYEVKGRCINTASGTASDFSQTSPISFRTSWKPSDGSVIGFVWTPSTDDVSWASTSQEGSNYLFDRMIGAPVSTCQNGTVPSSYRFQISKDGGNTWFTTDANTSPYVNRSSLSTQSDTYWPMGLSIQVRGQAICSDPFDDYAAIPSTYSNWSGVTELGYSAPDSVTGLNCVTKYQRLTEANRGACSYDSTVAAQTFTPDLVKWNNSVCVSGYTPRYSIRSIVGGTTGNWSDAGTATTWVPAVSNGSYPAGTAVQYEVKYKCENAASGKYSADSELTNKSFTLSNKPIETRTIEFNWTPSQDDWTWGNPGNYGGYWFYDRFYGTPTSTCSNGSAPSSYNIQMDRWGMGTYSNLNGQPSATISRSQIASPDSYWPQGAGMGIHAQAICSDPYGDYASVAQNWSGWAGPYYMAVSAPAAPASAWSDGWGTFYWSGVGCSYADGGYAQYASRQGRYGNEWGWWGAYGWGGNTSSSIPRYTEGYPFDMYARAVCISRYGVWSPESGERGASWTAGMGGSAYVYLPAVRTGAVDGYCNAGAWADSHRLYFRSAAGLNHGWYWTSRQFIGSNIGNFGSNYAVSGYVRCLTSWNNRTHWSWGGTNGNYATG